MWAELTQISILCSSFCLIDKILTDYSRLEGIYYLIHSLHNAAIVYLTGTEVVNSLTNFSYILNSPQNIVALELVFALHFYHIIRYWQKLRYDDWLHHILMIGIALPIGWATESHSLLGYNLFFTTGLPGGIDYVLLFLVRNGFMQKETEKNANAYINTWIRSPGCVSHATLTMLLMSTTMEHFSINWWGGMIVAILTFWNGQYFMRQVVENNALYGQKLSS